MPQVSTPHVFLGSAYAALSFAAFSTHDALIKTLAGYPVFQIIFFAVLFSLIPVILYLMLDRRERSLRCKVPHLMAVRCLGILGSTLGAFYAFSVLPLAQVYALIFSAPVIITLLAIPFLGERVHLIRWLAILLGLAGVLVVLQPGRSPLSVGHLAGFGAAVSLAASSISTRMIGNREHNATLVIYPMMTMLLACGVATIWLYKPLSGEALAILFAIGSLNVLGQALLVLAYRASEAQFVAPVQYTQILWAIFFGTVFFGEQISLHVLAGSAIIILSGLLFVWRELTAPGNKPVLRTRNLRGAAGPATPPLPAENPGQEHRP
ncbi:DMT family transporter [Granulosicoccaceae sp. 1_MG-2023]|nr:DMT family transporter [Granulosicoccaceae sp. 1_MG-2023]